MAFDRRLQPARPAAPAARARAAPAAGAAPARAGLLPRHSLATLPILPDPPVQLARGKNAWKRRRKQARLERMDPDPAVIEPPAYDVVGHSRTTRPFRTHEIPVITRELERPDGSRPSRSQVPEGVMGLNKDDQGMIDPHRLRTIHQGISTRFSSGKKIAETARELEEGTVTPDKMPATALFMLRQRQLPWTREDPLAPRNMMETSAYSVDHRRVVAHRMANKPILYRPGGDEEANVLRGKYTTKTQGLSVELRDYHDAAEGAHQRSNRSTLGRYRMDPNPKMEDAGTRDDASRQYRQLVPPGHANRLPQLYQFIKHFHATPAGIKAQAEIEELVRAQKAKPEKKKKKGKRRK